MRFLKFISVVFFSVLLISSCTNDITYADQLKAEKKLISDFISRQNIQVVTTMPTTYPWPKNVYYKSSTGLYFRLEDQGDKYVDGVLNTDSAETNDKILFRHMQYTLNSEADTISYLNTSDNAFPVEFYFNDLTDEAACSGWHEAVSYMKYNNASAKIIVYSKLGFSTTDLSVIPYGFDITMKLRK